MIEITVNNNKCKFRGSNKKLLKLIEHPRLCIRAPGAFFTEAFKKRRWDGMVRFVTATGVFDTGLLPDVLDILKDEEVELVDERQHLAVKNVVQQIEEFKARDYQGDAVSSVTSHIVGGLPFPRGVIFAATNAGKTFISASLHITYGKKTLFLVNSKELYVQMKEELEDFIPGQIGYISSDDGIVWNDFMLVMVKTAVNKKHLIESKLATYKVTIVDECDLATSKTYLDVLKMTFNSYVKVGLSGSVFARKLVKDKIKNNKIIGSFGPLIYEIRNRELMDKGHSSEVKVYIWKGSGNDNYESYPEAEKKGIIFNKKRNRAIMGRLKVHVNNERLPILIMVAKHDHVDLLYKKIFDKFPDLIVDWVHHKRKNRDFIVKEFKDNNIDILIGSYILKRGKNFPWVKALMNAGGGDSAANVLQILGRATRTHESKDLTYMDDFWDEGRYLLRHSKHRHLVYKNEKLEVVLKYK